MKEAWINQKSRFNWSFRWGIQQQKKNNFIINQPHFLLEPFGRQFLVRCSAEKRHDGSLPVEFSWKENQKNKQPIEHFCKVKDNTDIYWTSNKIWPFIDHDPLPWSYSAFPPNAIHEVEENSFSVKSRGQTWSEVLQRNLSDAWRESLNIWI